MTVRRPSSAGRDEHQRRRSVEVRQEDGKEMILKDTQENMEMLDAVPDAGGKLGAELDAG